MPKAVKVFLTDRQDLEITSWIADAIMEILDGFIACVVQRQIFDLSDDTIRINHVTERFLF